MLAGSLFASVRDYRVLPTLVVPILCAATLAWGGDSHQAGFLYASAIFVVTALALLIAHGPVLPPFLASGFVALSIYLAFVAHGAGPPHVEYATFLASGAIFLCARMVGLSRRATRRAWIACLSLAALYALWSLWGALIGADTPNQRLAGSFLSANTAATLLGMIAILATCELRRMRVSDLIRRRQRSGGSSSEGLAGLIAIAAFLFSLVGVFLSGSRAGTVLCMLAVLALIWWKPRRERQRNLLALTLVAVAVGASGGLVADRFVSIESAWQTRLTYFAAYWQAIETRPFFGYGLGGFERAVNDIATPANAVFLQKQGAAHNAILQWLIQAGLLGSLMMWMLIASIMRDIWRGIGRVRTHRHILRASVCVCAFVLAHGMVDYALEIPGFMWWWAWILGLAHGVASKSASGR